MKPPAALKALAAHLASAGVDPAGLALLPGAREPLPRLVVPGAEARALQERLRALDTGHYPLLLGPEEELELLREQLGASEEEDTGALLAQAQALSPEPARWAGARLAGLVQLMHDAGLEPQLDAQEFAEAEAALEAEERAAEGAPAQGGGFTHDAATGQPHARVALALLPACEPWQVPVRLRFGGFNECPTPAQHGAMLRHWQERYGAEPVALSHDALELRVQRPPTDVAAARQLAREQVAYCPELAPPGAAALERLAAKLQGARVWRFWWE
ncbi:MAG TPA: DUF4253 domain-containing protein [Aggregicoccus sp.]|nr:DUF4253 domain-containing protein [Aggregicoccus sp.]